MNCQPVPDDLVALTAQLSEVLDEPDKAASQLTIMFARMCNLMASSRCGGHIDYVQLLDEATRLDDELGDWARNLPSTYQFSNVVPEPIANAYSDTCHAYPSMFSAEIWLLYRSARFGINGLVASLCAASVASEQGSPEPGLSLPVDNEENDVAYQLQESLAAIDLLRTDMCDAIPYLLEYLYH